MCCRVLSPLKPQHTSCPLPYIKVCICTNCLVQTHIACSVFNRIHVGDGKQDFALNDLACLIHF